MTEVLCIAFSCPPILDAQSILLAKMLRPLQAEGCRLRVVGLDPDTCIGSQDDSLCDLLPPDTEVLRVAASERRLWYRAVARLVPSLLRVPDRHAPVHFRAVRAGMALHAERPADLLFSWAQYHSCSLVALNLKKPLGTPWVAHFSDPWREHPYRRPRRYVRWINARMESSVIHAADALVFVSEEMRDWTMSRYPSGLKSKTHIIPHCFESALYPEGSAPHSGIVFRHIGHFYGARGAGYLLKAIARARATDPLRLADARIEFIGHVEPQDKEQIHRMELDELVHLRPEIGYLESLREMREADVLILVEAPAENNIFLPSKLVDYLGAGAPILALTPSRGPAANLLSGPVDRVVAPEDVDGITVALRGYVDQLRNGNAALLQRDPGAVARFEARATMGQLAEVFRQVLDRRRTGIPCDPGGRSI